MKKLYFIPLLLFALLVSCSKSQQEVLSVIPMPQSVEMQKGTFLLNAGTPLVIEAPESDKQALQEYLSCLGMNVTDQADKAVVFKQVSALDGLSSDEAYQLTITPNGVTIQATTGAGLFYGATTLLQMHMESPELPACVIKDEPRFEYRGLMMDVSRHFFSKEFVLKQIEALSYFKMNRLHLHLTDGAGWRLEIKKYPRLTQLTAWRTHHNLFEWSANGGQFVEEGSEGADGGYYTQDDIREIVAFAQKHYVTIIPEIEMPGHSNEVATAYPELSCTHEPYKQGDFCIGNEKTFEFLQNVLLEVMELFPSEYIHIGGDEAGKHSWRTCRLCQARMHKEGLKDVDELQSYMISRIEKFVNEHGRSIIGWDEILEGGLAPNATVMSWRGVEGGIAAVKEGHKAIMTPGEYCYFDKYQDAPYSQLPAISGYLPLEKVYAYNPVPDTLTAEQQKLFYGVQANVWAEFIPTYEHEEEMIYPRVIALAEVAWTQPERKDYANFRPRAEKANDYLISKGYHAFDLHKEIGTRPESVEPVSHLALNKPVTFAENCPYSEKYACQGTATIVDGLRGSWSYGNEDRWQGFCDEGGFDATIDLEQSQTIHSVSADFLHIPAPNVFFPGKVIISVSEDGTNYNELKTIDFEVEIGEKTEIKAFGWEGEIQARYIRYQAQYAPAPAKSFLFVDEIIVK